MLKIYLIVGTLNVLASYSNVESQNATTGTILPQVGCPYVAPDAPCPNKIRFYLVVPGKNGTLYDEYELDVRNLSTILNAPFLKGRNTTLSIHGFLGNKTAPPNEQLIPAYMKNKNMNLLIVDYGQLVSAVACIGIVPFNTPFVAKCLAQFIDAVFTLRKDIQFSKFHIVSFSMGTLCAGQMHRYLTIGKIPRITGLDPAPNGFFSPLTISPEYQLTPRSADYVACIHTNAGGIGRLFPSAHSDCYVNFGIFQPSCVELSSNIINDVSCSHYQSCKVYAATINPTIGVYGSALTSRSVPQCAPIGEYNHNAFGLYHTFTRPTPPYALGIETCNTSIPSILADLIKSL